jgi:hypothetical protein
MQYSLINKFRGAFVGYWIGQNYQLSENWEKIITICLFYHDDLTTQAEKLKQICPPNLDPNGLIVMGYIISLICTEKFYSHQLINQTITFLGTSPFTSCLNQIKIYLENSAGLTQIISDLQNKFTPEKLNFILGFYYFLSVPEDFTVTINRGMNFNPKTQSEAIVIAAILSGCYNSIVSVPSRWYKNHTEIITKSDHLFMNWAGFSDNMIINHFPIAAAGVIQSR